MVSRRLKKLKKRFMGQFKNPSRQVIFTKPSPIYSFFTSFRIFYEFFTGFLFVANFAKAVSFFGSARECLDEKYYRDCEELAARLSNEGFAVITGGSGGIMRAANKGSKKVNGESVGVNIILPNEQGNNHFLKHSKDFKYFFSRKTILSCASELYIFFPGGFGTLDELFEMLTMVQTGHSDPVPIILYGKDFWEDMVSFIEKKLAKKFKTIDEKDCRLFVVVDSVDEAELYVKSLDFFRKRVCKIGSIG